MSRDETLETLETYTVVALTELCSRLDPTCLPEEAPVEIGKAAGQIAVTAMLTGFDLLDEAREKLKKGEEE